MPRRRRILPIKMRARSKKNMRPRKRKNVPEPVKAAPIFWVSLIHIVAVVYGFRTNVWLGWGGGRFEG